MTQPRRGRRAARARRCVAGSPASTAWWTSRAGIDVPAQERVEHAPVQLGAAPAGERLLDHAPGELVPEANDAAFDDRAARAPRTRRARPARPGLAHEPQLGRARHDRDELERRARVRGELARTGEHRIAHRRRRQLAAGGDRLGDEERVAAGDGVQLVGAALRPAPATASRESGGTCTRRTAVGRERAEHAVQRVVGDQLVVAEREHDQRGQLLDPAPQERQARRGTRRPPSGRPRRSTPSAARAPAPPGPPRAARRADPRAAPRGARARPGARGRAPRRAAAARRGRRSGSRRRAHGAAHARRRPARAPSCRSPPRPRPARRSRRARSPRTPRPAPRAAVRARAAPPAHCTATRLPGIAAAPAAPRHRLALKIALVVSIAVAFADSSIVVLALPELFLQLQTTIPEISWVVTAYNLAVVVGAFALLPFLGRVRPAWLALAGSGSLRVLDRVRGLGQPGSARRREGRPGDWRRVPSRRVAAVARRPQRRPRTRDCALGRRRNAGNRGRACVGRRPDGGVRLARDLRRPGTAGGRGHRRRAHPLARGLAPPAERGRAPLGSALALILTYAALVGALFLSVLLVVTAWDYGPLAGAAVVSAYRSRRWPPGRSLRDSRRRSTSSAARSCSPQGSSRSPSFRRAKLRTPCPRSPLPAPGWGSRCRRSPAHRSRAKETSREAAPPRSASATSAS